MGHKKWSELSTAQRSTLITAALAQFALAGTAWWDLSRRPAVAVRGSKTAWGFLIAVNFVGPVAYLRFGRKPAAEIRSPLVPLD